MEIIFHIISRVLPEIEDDNVISLASYYNYYEDYRYRLDLAFYDNGGIMIWNPQIGIISKDDEDDGTIIHEKNVDFVHNLKTTASNSYS